MTQDLLDKPTQVADPPAVDPEALIKEARDRARRRRLRTLAAVLALAAIGGGAYGVIRATDSNGNATAHLPNRPIVNVRAFTGHGTIAFISRGQLWVLDGQSGKLRAMPRTGFPPIQPVFSPDGKWLAYLQQHNSPTTSDYSRLWIARADGSDAHVVPDLHVQALFGWNPHADLLAVSTGPERSHQPCPCYSPTELRVVSPDLSSRIVARAGWINGASWSPDGSEVAVAAIGQNEAKLIVYPLSGGGGRVWLARQGPQTLNGMKSILFTIAGWWPHIGIGIWVVGNGAVRNLDGTPLDAISTPGARPTTLGRTLSDKATDPVSAGSRGEVAVVVDHGGGRSAWQGKHVELCSESTHTCRVLPHARGDVTVDPIWAPDGRTLIYAEAPNVTTGPWSQKRIAAWFDAHRLLIYDTVTRRVRSLGAGHGATAVNVSDDGKSLLYVRNDALWLLPTLDGTPVQIAGRSSHARSGRSTTLRSLGQPSSHGARSDPDLSLVRARSCWCERTTASQRLSLHCRLRDGKRSGCRAVLPGCGTAHDSASARMGGRKAERVPALALELDDRRGDEPRRCRGSSLRGVHEPDAPIA